MSGVSEGEWVEERWAVVVWVGECGRVVVVWYRECERGKWEVEGGESGCTVRVRVGVQGE